jgi:hypothetical protein
VDDVKVGRSTNEDAFVLWNLELLRAFFSPGGNGAEVWIQVDPDSLDVLCPFLGGDEGFLKAVREGPPWVTIDGSRRGTPEDLVGRVKGLVRQRGSPRRRPPAYVDPGELDPAYKGRDAPSYLPFLAALVRQSAAANNAGGYYAGLRESIGLEQGWGSQNMAELETAWRDLERWSLSQNGEFGRFVFRVLGGYERIGVPKSQSILTNLDGERMSMVFAQVRLRPGQSLRENQLEEIKERAGRALFLSASFREAACRTELSEPVADRVRALFEEWDGTVPGHPDAGTDDANAGDRDLGRTVGITLCLRLGPGNELPWRIHWRVSLNRDSGQLLLRSDHNTWRAPLLGAEGSTTEDVDPQDFGAARQFLGASARGDVMFKALHVMEDSERDLGEAVLSKEILRVLCWVHDPVTRRDELRERPLPLHGRAYLLIPQSNIQAMMGYLQREGIDYDEVPTDGLPDGWRFVSIGRCEALDEDKRDTLPDGKDTSTRSRSRIVRVVGGRSLRQHGSRVFLPYDLPAVELDAAPDTTVAADGLRLTEEAVGANEHIYGVRRFAVEITDRSRRYFEIRALGPGGALEGTATLKVTSPSNEFIGEGENFSLDPMGNPLANRDGLRGVLGAADGSNPVTSSEFDVDPSELGVPIGRERLEDIQAAPWVRFLDSLALSGAMVFGAARNQLSRLLAQAEVQKEAVFTLLDLRACGHLELESNAKGHLTRVHAVNPALVRLPIRVSGMHVYGLIGTVPIGLWQRLSAHAPGIHPYLASSSGIAGESVRIVVETEDAVRRYSQELNLRLHDMMAMRVARWAASRDAFMDAVSRYAGEGFVGDRSTLAALRLGSAKFGPVSHATVEGGRYQIFEAKDSATGDHHVYMLGMRSQQGTRFAFVRDKRWGIWLTLCGFGEFVRDELHLHDAFPWPFAYSAAKGVLWIPARAAFPVVLERALTLCSASPPDVFEMRKQLDGNELHLVHARSQVPAMRLSGVYDYMAEGRWLAYKWVPREVANLVVTKLGGVLAEG